MLSFRFLYAFVFYFLIPFLFIAAFYRYKFYKYPLYSYPLASFFKGSPFYKKSLHKQFFYILRFLILLILIFLIARPQWIDTSSSINVEGIDMVLAIDVSGSMKVFDDLKDRTSRLDAAKNEALRFVEKRPNDPIGIVLFAKSAVSSCPITLDKNILKETIGGLRLGIIDEAGTSLGTGLALAVNRLRSSKSKNKVIILLTDGVPSPQTDKVSPQIALEIAKKFGVKIYTIGVGNKHGGYARGPFGELMGAGIPLDMVLLKTLAKETGGRAFRAQSPRDMREIYNIIDKLETTEIKTPIFQNIYEAYKYFIWLLVILLLLEIIFRFCIWRGISC